MVDSCVCVCGGGGVASSQFGAKAVYKLVDIFYLLCPSLCLHGVGCKSVTDRSIIVSSCGDVMTVNNDSHSVCGCASTEKKTIPPRLL